MPIAAYFLAPDDATAVTALADGGPGSTSFPVVEAKGMDPVVTMGNLESILTGRPYGVVVGAPRQGHAVGDASDAVVVAITDSLRDALAGASPTSWMTRGLGWPPPRSWRGRARQESRTSCTGWPGWLVGPTPGTCTAVGRCELNYRG